MARPIRVEAPRGVMGRAHSFASPFFAEEVVQIPHEDIFGEVLFQRIEELTSCMLPSALPQCGHVLRPHVVAHTSRLPVGLLGEPRNFSAQPRAVTCQGAAQVLEEPLLLSGRIDLGYRCMEDEKVAPLLGKFGLGAKHALDLLRERLFRGQGFRVRCRDPADILDIAVGKNFPGIPPRAQQNDVPGAHVRPEVLASLLIDLVALPVPTVGVLRLVRIYFGRTVVIAPLNGEVVQLHGVQVHQAVNE